MGKRLGHEEVNQLLPWLVNDSLTGKERQQVMLHLQDCATCQHERDRLQEVESLVLSDDQPVPDYHFAFKKLQRRIEDAEARSGYAAEPNPGFNWRVLTSVAAVLALVAVLVVPTDNTVPSTFQTLTSSASVATEGSMRQLNVAMNPETAGDDFKALLIATEATLISGPDYAGVYHLNVRVPDGLSDQEYLQSLLSRNGVQRAELSPSN